MTQRRPFVECSVCGELNRPRAGVCGACGARLESAAADTAAEGASTASIAALVLAFIPVWIGVMLIAPGLGVLLAIAAVIPFLRTLAVLQRRTAAGRPTSYWAAIGLFAGSIAFSLTIVTVVTIAAVGTFCFVCIAGASASGGDSQSVQRWLLISGLVTAAVCIGLGARIVARIRARWRRDVGER